MDRLAEIGILPQETVLFSGTVRDNIRYGNPAASEEDVIGAAKAAQALGQKNNSFVIWIALTFSNPLVAMRPAFYILYHNIYNSWQIYRFESRRNE
jgi:hypothetical protein